MSKPILGIERWHLPHVLGFAAHWVWIWCVFWSPMFYEVAADAGIAPGGTFGTLALWSGLEPLWTVSLGSNVVSIGALLLLSRRRNPLAGMPWLPWVAAGLTTVGTLMLNVTLLGLAGPAASVLYLIGSVLTGIGSGGVVVLWGELFACVGARETISYSILALIAAAGVHAIVMLMPLPLAQFLVALLPGISMGLLLDFRHGLPRAPRSSRNRRVEAHTPWRMVLIALVFGFSFGVMKGLMAPLPQELLGVRNTLNIVAIIAGALLMLLASNVLKLDFNQLTYQVALPLMAAGFLFIPLQGLSSVLGTAVHQCGYQYFYIVLWATWPIIAQRGEVPAGWVAANGMFAVQLGQLIGSVGSALLLGILVTDLGRAMFSSVAIFIMLLVALFVFGNKTADTGWGFIRPAEVQGTSTELDDTAARIARRRRLSPRETDVFLLLAKGRNRAYIANELVIGDETVKSHIKNVYKKMGVHSQQELLDAIEAETGAGSGSR